MGQDEKSTLLGMETPFGDSFLGHETPFMSDAENARSEGTFREEDGFEGVPTGLPALEGEPPPAWEPPKVPDPALLEARERIVQVEAARANADARNESLLRQVGELQGRAQLVGAVALVVGAAIGVAIGVFAL